MDFDWIHRLAFFGGLIVLLVSLVMSANRTSNWSGLLRFWEKRVEMTATEFKIHRTGLAMMIVGVVLNLASQLL